MVVGRGRGRRRQAAGQHRDVDEDVDRRRVINVRVVNVGALNRRRRRIDNL